MLEQMVDKLISRKLDAVIGYYLAFALQKEFYLHNKYRDQVKTIIN